MISLRYILKLKNKFLSAPYGCWNTFLVNNHSNVKLIHSEKINGKSESLNQGFRFSLGEIIITMDAFILHYTNYGSIYKSEFILQFRIKNDGNNSQEYSKIISRYAKKSTLLHVEPSGDNNTSKISFDIIMKKDENQIKVASDIAKHDEVSEVALVAAKHDVDYRLANFHEITNIGYK